MLLILDCSFDRRDSIKPREPTAGWRSPGLNQGSKKPSFRDSRVTAIRAGAGCHGFVHHQEHFVDARLIAAQDPATKQALEPADRLDPSPVGTRKENAIGIDAYGLLFHETDNFVRRHLPDLSIFDKPHAGGLRQAESGLDDAVDDAPGDLIAIRSKDCDAARPKTSQLRQDRTNDGDGACAG